MIAQDWQKWIKNSLIFAGPALIVLVASIIEVIPQEGIWGAIVLYLLNVITDLLKKFLSQNKY